MTGYALLILPAANRVYARASARLTRAELEAYRAGDAQDLEVVNADTTWPVARRDQLAAIMASAGLQVVDGDAYLQLQHRVDQAIVRDVLVARRPPYETLTVSFSIQTAWVGKSPFWPPSGTWLILSTTDWPETTLPKTA
jgi:hypothetical protein